MKIHFAGNFPTHKACKYHCFPNCHPVQIDENDWKYGCTHNVWTCNREGDFVPIVQCGGNPDNCPLKGKEYKDMILDYLLECSEKTYLSMPELVKARSEIEDLNELLKQ